MSKDDYNEISKIDETLFSNDYNQLELQKKIDNLLNKIQEKFREKWSTFNTIYCMLGLATLVLSILTLITKMTQLHGEDESSCSNNFELFKYWSFMLIITMAFNLICGINLFSNIWLGLLIFNLTFLFRNLKRSNLVEFLKNGFLNIFECQILIVVLLIPFSNSFIINENISLRFVLVTLLYVQSFFTKSTMPIFLTALVRTSSLFYVCREETASYCNQTIFSTQLEKLTPYNFSNYLMFIIFNFFLIFTLFVFLLKNNTTKIFSFINLLNFFNFICLLIYNLIQLYLYEYSILNQQWLHLKDFNIYIARLIYVCVALVIYLSRSSKFRLFNSIVAIGIFTSLISSQSLLSIWMLIFIMFFIPKYKPSILKSNFFNLNYIIKNFDQNY